MFSLLCVLFYVSLFWLGLWTDIKYYTCHSTPTVSSSTEAYTLLAMLQRDMQLNIFTTMVECKILTEVCILLFILLFRCCRNWNPHLVSRKRKTGWRISRYKTHKQIMPFLNYLHTHTHTHTELWIKGNIIHTFKLSSLYSYIHSVMSKVKSLHWKPKGAMECKW